MRTITRSTAALLCTAAWALFMVPSAHAAPAAPGAIVCPEGSQTASYTPHLTNTPRKTRVRLNENYTCSSTPAGISSVQGSASFHEQASCPFSVQPAVIDVLRYKWNTGQSSTVTFNRTTVARAADGTTTVTAVGSVTKGFKQGSKATRVVVLPTLDLFACATNGVAAQTGTATLEVQ